MKNFVQVRIESPAFEPDAVQIVELTGRETISRLFEFKLHLATAGGNLDEDKLLTSAVTLVFERRVRDSSEASRSAASPGSCTRSSTARSARARAASTS